MIHQRGSPENQASNGSASYYAWDPPEAPGFRFISIDTLSEGGVVEQSSNGNIDDPQFQWLQREKYREQATRNYERTIEALHGQWLRMVSVSYDSTAGIITRSTSATTRTSRSRSSS